MKTYTSILFWALLLSIAFSCSDDDSPMVIVEDPDPDPVDTIDLSYFPPLDQDTWDTVLPGDLDWNEDKLSDLVDYVGSKNSKSLLILHKGKIVVEEYFDGHTSNTVWPWYSAVKSMTSVGVAIAQEENLLSIEDKTSDYLGENWTSLQKEKQDLIKVRNHLTMTTGLKNSIGQLIPWTCIAPLCMQYEADAGTRWAYHQGAFTQTQEILTSATGMNFQQYLREKIQNKIGINGSWSSILDVRIFSSNTRGMARFGLLALNKGNWDGQEIYPEDYHTRMTNTSQEHNKAYGYLWWLNGKENLLSTISQTIIPGPLVPNAPADMFAALGAEDQKIYVVPSLDLVVVRTGKPANNMEFALSSFDNELWDKINDILP